MSTTNESSYPCPRCKMKVQLWEEHHCSQTPPDTIRAFSTGATRDTEAGKLDFEGFNNPLVDERYAEYLNKHRIQSDGKLRDGDNWQNLFGEEHFKVCIKSAFRHFNDLRKLHRGYKTVDRKTGEIIDKESAICATIFNLKAYLFKLLMDKQNTLRPQPPENKVR